MKRIFKVFILFVCLFSVMLPVYAETGSYKPGNVTYCFKKNGTFAKKISGRNTSCPGYYTGTVYKQINGSDAYCARHHISMSYGKSCTAIKKYNKYSWMNGNWTEANAIKVGYMIQYIKNKKLSKANEYTAIFNGVQQMLRFDDSLASRKLNSTITNAINHGKEQVKYYKKVSTTTPVTVKFSNATLTNVNNSYAKGVVSVSLANGSYGSAMTVTATCTNCKLYTDASFTNLYKGTTLKASAKQNLTLYVKTDSYSAGSKATVSFKASYGKITYPIAKLWNCGSNKQPLVTLTSTTWQPAGATVSSAATVPAKRLCQYYDGKYFGKNGDIVSQATYQEECLKICKVVDGKYYGKNGTEVTKEQYTVDCLKPTCKIVDGKYYGKNGTEVTKEQYTVDCLKPTCKIVDDKYYGKNGTEVTKEQYTVDCLKPTCKIIDGIYYGSNGTVVTKEQYTVDCLKPMCKVVDGKYYGKDGSEVDKVTYTKECLKPVCKVVDGVYYGKNGDEVDSDTYKSECEKICQISDGKYYGSNGNVVTEETYKYECTTPVCGIRDGRYYGKDATEVSREEYKEQCEPAVITDVPSTGTNTSAIPMVLGSLLVIGGIGSITYNKKKNSISK